MDHLTDAEMKIAHAVLDALGMGKMDDYTAGYHRGYEVGKNEEEQRWLGAVDRIFHVNAVHR